MLFVACLTSQQHACVSQGRTCSDNCNCTCCHTEMEVADQTCCLTQSQYTDTGPTSPRTDPGAPGAWQGAARAPMLKSTGPRKAGFEPRIFHSPSGRLTAVPPRQRYSWKVGFRMCRLLGCEGRGGRGGGGVVVGRVSPGTPVSFPASGNGFGQLVI